MHSPGSSRSGPLRAAFGRLQRAFAAARALWVSDAARAWRAQPGARLLARTAQAGLLLALLGYLVWRLTHIGWSELLASLPGNPWFYVLFALGYLLLPASELWIYGRHWGRPLWRQAWAFLVKRAYNFGVFDMSGEAYFGVWASRRLGLSAGKVLATLKDVNLLSAAASNLATPVFLAALFLFAHDGVEALRLPAGVVFWGFASIAALAAATLLAGLFQRHILSVDRAQARATFWAHLARFVLGSLLQALQWAVVFPEAPFTIWLWFLALQLAVSRIPVLPNRDLVFVGLSLSLAHAVNAPEAAVAAMFVMSAALMQVANMAVIGVEAGVGAVRARAPRGTVA